MKRFLEEGRIEGEKESVLPSVGEERIGGAYTLRKESKEELFREMLIPTKLEYGSSEEREEVESSDKDWPCLTKMTTPPLACVVSEERMPDRK